MIRQISPVSNNNPNFKGLVVSRKTLKSLGYTRKDLLNNEFIKKSSELCDVYISSDASLFKKATQYAIKIGEKLKFPIFKSTPAFKNVFIKETTFNAPEELDSITKKIKDAFDWNFAKQKYAVEYDAFKHLEKGEHRPFEEQMQYIMLSIASIPNTLENKKINDFFLSKLKELRFWKPLSKKENSIPYNNHDYWRKLNLDKNKTAGLRAIESNNLELLKFLKEKGENLNQCLDLMKEGNVSDEVKDILKDVKYQDEKVFDLEDVLSSNYLLEKFWKENENIDINSRNSDGDTLVHKAIKEENIDLLKYLSTRDDVNWKIFNYDCNNALLLALKSEKPTRILSILKSLPKEKISISDESLYQGSPLLYAIGNNRKCIDSLLEFDGVDVMSRGIFRGDPLIFYAMRSNVNDSTVRTMLEHPSFDFYGKGSIGGLLDYAQIFGYENMVYWFIPEFIAKETQGIYEKEGELTLEQIERFLNAFNKDSDFYADEVKFNSIGDTIGHLLCDIHIDLNDFELMKKVSKIIDDMIALDFRFDTKNEIGQTIISKAIEYENTGLVRLLLDKKELNHNLGFVNDAFRDCKNEEILNILQNSFYGAYL